MPDSNAADPSSPESPIATPHAEACPRCGRRIKGRSDHLSGAVSADGQWVWCCNVCGGAVPRLCGSRREHWIIAFPCGHEQLGVGLALQPVADFIDTQAAGSPSPTGTRAHLGSLLNQNDRRRLGGGHPAFSLRADAAPTPPVVEAISEARAAVTGDDAGASDDTHTGGRA